MKKTYEKCTEKA